MTTPKTVEDLMSRNVLTVHEEDNLGDAESTMERHGFRHVPVVDGERLVGLLTQRDLLRFSASPLEARADQLDAEIKTRTFVADVMTREITTVQPETPLVQAADLILAGRLGCLPVVSSSGKLVGIVTATDFVRLAARFLEEG